LIENIKNNNVKAIFVEPEYNLKIVNAISKETGAKIYTLNPVTFGENSKEEYINIMNKNLKVLKEALS
jgi:zinc transport system substrate-binding protein